MAVFKDTRVTYTVRTDEHVLEFITDTNSGYNYILAIHELGRESNRLVFHNTEELDKVLTGIKELFEEHLKDIEVKE